MQGTEERSLLADGRLIEGREGNEGKIRRERFCNPCG